MQQKSNCMKSCQIQCLAQNVFIKWTLHLGRVSTTSNAAIIRLYKVNSEHDEVTWLNLLINLHFTIFRAM